MWPCWQLVGSLRLFAPLTRSRLPPSLTVCCWLHDGVAQNAHLASKALVHSLVMRVSSSPMTANINALINDVRVCMPHPREIQTSSW
jgi:hypothetical protein